MTPQQIADIAAATAEKAHTHAASISEGTNAHKQIAPLCDMIQSLADCAVALAERTGPVLTERDAAADLVGEHRPDNPTTPEGVEAKSDSDARVREHVERVDNESPVE